MTPDAPTSAPTPRAHPWYGDVTCFDDVRLFADAVYVMVDGHDVLVGYGADGRYHAHYQGDEVVADTALGAVLAMFGPKAPRLSTGGTCPHP